MGCSTCKERATPGSGTTRQRPRLGPRNTDSCAVATWQQRGDGMTQTCQEGRGSIWYGRVQCHLARTQALAGDHQGGHWARNGNTCVSEVVIPGSGIAVVLGRCAVSAYQPRSPLGGARSMSTAGQEVRRSHIASPRHDFAEKRCNIPAGQRRPCRGVLLFAR